jgi:post-segregation antitoxin (ccd killing protein)
MTARLNITIPDQLHERLQAAKESQSDLNVSAICQEAIEAAVKLAECRKSAGSKRERAIERLNLQIRRGQKEWYKRGRQDGLNDASELDYEDFSIVTEALNQEINLPQMMTIPGYFQSVEKSAAELECPQAMRSAYYAGWIDGVLEFWNDVKDELAIDELELNDTPNAGGETN